MTNFILINIYFYIFQVHALLCVSSPYELDLISFNLPIMKQIGDKVHIQCTSLRPYETFYQDLKKLSSS